MVPWSFQSTVVVMISAVNEERQKNRDVKLKSLVCKVRSALML